MAEFAKNKFKSFFFCFLGVVYMCTGDFGPNLSQLISGFMILSIEAALWYTGWYNEPAKKDEEP